MKIKKIEESEVKEAKYGHRVLSPNRVFEKNKKNIEELLQQIAQSNNVTVEDAAYALQNVLTRLVGGTKPD